jgi:hypothetical protein
MYYLVGRKEGTTTLVYIEGERKRKRKREKQKTPARISLEKKTSADLIQARERAKLLLGEGSNKPKTTTHT